MPKQISFNELKDPKKSKQSVDLHSFAENFQSALITGKSIKVDGTNVIRVPFGVRHSRKQRPQRPDNWATLVLPIQPAGSPNPPPQAA